MSLLPGDDELVVRPFGARHESTDLATPTYGDVLVCVDIVGIQDSFVPVPVRVSYS